MKKRYQIAFSAVFLIALVYLLGSLKLEKVIEEISNLNKVFLVLGVLAMMVGALVKILRFSLVTQYYDKKIPYIDAALIQMVGISLAIITPARVGEGSKAVLLNKKSRVPISRSLGIVIFERFFDMLFLASGAFIFSFYVLSNSGILLIGALLIALLVFFVLFLRHFNTFKRIVPKKYRHYFTEVELKKNPVLVLSILLTTGLTWSLEAVFPWLLAQSMNVYVPFLLVFGIVCISLISVVFSVFPAGLGTMDLSFLVLFPLIGVSIERALSILLIYRFFGILTPFLFSFLILNYQGTSFKEIRMKLKGR